MDALALLCTLHADGPATLRLLRQAGCVSLERLEELDAERLAELLGLTPATSRRFLRESRNLRARLGDDLLEQEDASPSLATTPVATTEVPGTATPETSTAVTGSAPLGSRDQSIMDRVLSAWRERDDHEPAVAEAHGAYAPLGADPSPDEFLAADQVTGASSALRPGALDGLTEACCQRLTEAGVYTVDELLARDSLELATAADLSFTLIERLQFLARRQLPAKAEQGPARAEPASSRFAESAAVPVASAPPAPSAKISVADSPDQLARPIGGWDFEMQPPVPVEPRVASSEPDQPADAAGPFA